MIKIIALLFIIISCVKKDERISLYDSLYLATNIEFNKSYLNIDEVKNPPGTVVELIKFNSKEDKQCLLYKTPFGEKRGKLFVSDCKDIKVERYFASGIHKLSIYLSTNRHSKRKGQLNLRYFENNKEIKKEIPLFNYRFKKVFTKYDNPIDEGFISNVMVGDFKLSEPLIDGKLCHGVNLNCQDITPNKCNDCENGFYEIVDFNCKQGGSKYCGEDRCGQKNRPACPRGYDILGTKLESLCFSGSPAGLCEAGLSTFCREDKILICI